MLDTNIVETWGFPMEVLADIEPPVRATFEDPGYGWTIVVVEARVGGIDIYEMLTPIQIERIEESIEELLEKQR